MLNNGDAEVKFCLVGLALKQAVRGASRRANKLKANTAKKGVFLNHNFNYYNNIHINQFYLLLLVDVV